MEMNSINEVQRDGIDLSNNYLENIQNNNKNIINGSNKKSLKFLFLIITIFLLVFLIIIILNICTNSKEDSIHYSKQYSFKLVYYSDKDKMKITLFNSSFIKNIDKMEINGETIIPCSEYNFKKEGNHTIYFNIQKDKTFSMDSMFKNINNLISIILSLY